MVDPDAREPSLIHFNSADLRYKTHETFTSGYTGTIIEELNDYSYHQRMFGDSSPSTSLLWLAILLIALGTSLIAALIDICAYNIGYYKKSFSMSLDDQYLSFLLWTSISLCFVCLGTSLGYFFTSDVDGSGIPEIKAVISGVELPKYMLWKTFMLKALGLVCCSASLSIGREGPHIHLASILAHKCLKHRIFEKLKKFRSMHTQVLQAAVTAGVAAVMGTPVGATFFCMEITASYYVVHNIMSSLACGVMCTMFLKLYHFFYLTEDFSGIEEVSDFNSVDIFLACVLGIICGSVGVLFVKTTKFFTRMRVRRAVLFLHKRFRYAIAVALLYSVACFLIPTFRLTAKSVFNDLIAKKDLHGEWEEDSVGKLILFGLAKPLFTALSISVQIPFGIFLPILDSGAALGRAFGILTSELGGIGSASLYAAIGGASLISSSTHALSAAIIIFEVTLEVKYVIPVTLAAVISCQIAKAFELNIYDVSIQSRNIPYLPAVRKEQLYSHSAKDIMEDVIWLGTTSSIGDLRKCLDLEDSHKIPIVSAEMYIVAETSARRVKKYIDHCIEVYSAECSLMVKEEIKKWRNEEEYVSPHSDKHLEQEMKILLKLTVDFTSTAFGLTRDPIAVSENTNLSKIHFMFHMLGLDKLYVTQSSKLRGIIKRTSFTSCK